MHTGSQLSGMRLHVVHYVSHGDYHNIFLLCLPFSLSLPFFVLSVGTFCVFAFSTYRPRNRIGKYVLLYYTWYIIFLVCEYLQAIKTHKYSIPLAS